MRHIPMPMISITFKGRKVVIPAGWSAFVPEMTSDPADEEAYAVVYAEDFKGDMAAARRMAREALMREYISCRCMKLHLVIRYWAGQYLRRHPKSLVWDGGAKEFRLNGFDPERIQLYYLPFDNTGRKGKPHAIKLLDKMYETRKGLLDEGRDSGDPPRNEVN